MDNIILVGFGGHAKSLADSIKRGNTYNIVGYTDIEDKNESEYCYLGTDDVLQEYYHKGIQYAIIGLGYLGKGNTREMLYNRLKKIGYELPVIIDPSAIVSNTASLGEGTFIGKAAIINAHVKIGNAVIVNTGAIVEHECEIDDFSHIAVSTVLCGNVKIGRSSFVGANATVIQDMELRSGSIVPAGETVR
ncbi:NeuD/PglB/VioB family sugar acetyltransferase [Gallibacter sp. Marseille-QA0791]|uniref:NeuD/PglB/VioB family sugar acetyltransferase n=1 Tax=Gallibacter sp. Marseille-QA0791 TaxID=3378781 RepID=UPI003D0E63BF